MNALLRLLLLLSVLMSRPALADMAALVVDVRGQSAPLELLDVLTTGQQLLLPAGTSLTLSFRQGGRRYECRGPALFAIGPEAPSKLSGDGSCRRIASQAQAATELHGPINWDKMAGLRRELVAWRLDEVVEPDAELRWEAPSSLEEVEITVERLPDFVRTWRSSLPATPSRARLPQSVLRPGERYELSLRGFGAGGYSLQARPQRVSVLSQRDWQRLQQFEQAAQQSQNPEDLVEYCAWLLQAGLQSRAARVARQLLERFPNSLRLRELAERAD